MDGLLLFIILVYLVLHIPAFILLIVVSVKRKKNPETAKKLFIAAGIYFLIGAGICGTIMTR